MSLGGGKGGDTENPRAPLVGEPRPPSPGGPPLWWLVLVAPWVIGILYLVFKDFRL